MKKWLRIPVLILLCGLFVILGCALALALYYRNNFPVNTWINGVYCTGKTIEEVNEELISQTELPLLVIEEADGDRWEISLQAADAKADYKSALKSYLYQNATYQWMNHLNEPVLATLDEVQYDWDREKLRLLFDNLSFVQEAVSGAAGVEVQQTAEGYVLHDGNTEHLNTEKAFQYVEKCLKKGEHYVRLKDGGCYETLKDDVQDKAQRLLWRQFEEIFACNLIYDMGAEQIPLTPDILSRFLTVDGDNVAVDSEGMQGWLEELAAEYNTVNTTRQFQSTRGDVVEVPYVTYGTELDTEAEFKWLMENVWENKKVRSQPEYHVPSYLREGFVRGLDDIGDTYIEVDMTGQHMYYYVEGELVLDTDVVTGNTGRRMGTPEGINYVYNKQKNRVLRGPGYATPVKYWVPVKGSIGIHDASWRTEFGGEIYKTNGSHGCINTPSDVMSELYDMVEIGTPVIMFY
ncbi:MAG: L,D-transpeptidase [Acetatifactor sp.]